VAKRKNVTADRAQVVRGAVQASGGLISSLLLTGCSASRQKVNYLPPPRASSLERSEAGNIPSNVANKGANAHRKKVGHWSFSELQNL
jgi:hypothetical protein